MKRLSWVLFYLVMTTNSFLLPIQRGHGQTRYMGTWEGIFMNEFQTRISLHLNDASQIEGNIKMFANNTPIQDDQLEDIRLVNNGLTFSIPAKETTFKGRFNAPITILSGAFLFPDGSKHAIQLKRKTAEAIPIEEFRLIKERKKEVHEWHSDLRFLYTTLKEKHPQLYVYTPKDSFELLVEQINREIDSECTLEKFYMQASRLANAVHCSHTGVKLPADYQNLTHDFGNYFPLRLFFENEKAFYLSGGATAPHQIVPGNEIISINDTPIKEILKQTFLYIPAEGHNTTTKYHELNKSFNQLFYLLDDSATFNVRYKTGASIKSITVPSANLANIKLNNDTVRENREVDFSTITNNSLGILTISSFAIVDMDHYFSQLEHIFNEIKSANIQNLVLDLRGNSGGHPIFAAQLFSYLTDKEFIYFKRNETIKDFEPLYTKMQPNKLNFTGNLYVLVNGGSLSTTGHLIALLKYDTHAIFIGEEPGSTSRCNDFSMQLVLPNSKIVVNVPRTTFETALSEIEWRTPFPMDYTINNRIEEMLNKNDPYIEKVKSLIKKGNTGYPPKSK